MRNFHWPVALTANICIALLTASPAIAMPGDWNGPGWRGNRPGSVLADDPRTTHQQPDRSREGRVEVNRFVADDPAAEALGHGPIVVSSQSAGNDYLPASDRAVFEAAIIDQLIRSGYDTTRKNPEGGQGAELRLTRTVLESAEAPHKPVSGQAAMEVSNRGTAYGLAVNVDLTKPLPPLVSTRLEARIVDEESGKVLWEGRAQIATREGDDDWPEQKIASRLAEALFDGFPHADDSIRPHG